MKPFICTVRALSELATGLSQDAIASSPTLYVGEYGDADVLIAAGDEIDEQRVVIIREEGQKDLIVPNHLSLYRKEALGRIASMAERAKTAGTLSLPKNWHQYKHNSLITFFAIPGGEPQATRWITELKSGPRHDVIFRAWTTSDHKETLQEFDQKRDKTDVEIEDTWMKAHSHAVSYFNTASIEPNLDTDMSLPPLEPGATRGWTYDHWLKEISTDQRVFIEASTDKSIRLRGPAGSGKTLSLTLKALREVLAARDAAADIRVLMVTHSWALATEIADSLTSMGMGLVNEIDVFPLLSIAQSVSPQYVDDDSGYSLIGNDNLSGKQAQLNEIRELLDDFLQGDWVTFRTGVSSDLASRLDTKNQAERDALAWDLSVEFGSVIGAAAIFPGAGAENRYAQIARAGWMMPLSTQKDLKVVFHLYEQYMKNLEERSLLTSDQVLADVLNHLETHAWNRARKTQGYDLIFVDEFHLFSPLERQVLHYLSKDVSQYPRVFMAVDPRQSPSESFIGIASDDTHADSNHADVGFGHVDNFDLTTAHRFTPQILGLIKHVHHRFPTLDLGQDWDIDFATVESSQVDGPIPKLTLAGSQDGESFDIGKKVHDLYFGGRMALAVVDSRQWRNYSQLAARIGSSGKFHVSTISGRSDVEGLGYRKRGLVVAPAEYLAGLQFETVLVAGIPDLRSSSTIHERTRFLSLLYLAMSRAEKEVQVFLNEEDGGIPDVLQQAATAGLIQMQRGSSA